MAQSFVVSKLSDSKLQLKLCPVKSCVICGEEGATPHWNGVLSCEGCATFYQRTIKKQRQYVCRFQGKCLVRNSKFFFVFFTISKHGMSLKSSSKVPNFPLIFGPHSKILSLNYFFQSLPFFCNFDENVICFDLI